MTPSGQCAPSISSHFRLSGFTYRFLCLIFLMVALLPNISYGNWLTDVIALSDREPQSAYQLISESELHKLDLKPGELKERHGISSAEYTAFLITRLYVVTLLENTALIEKNLQLLKDAEFTKRQQYEWTFSNSILMQAQGHLEEALEITKDALSQSYELDDKELILRSLAASARLNAYLENYDQAQQDAYKGYELAEQIESPFAKHNINAALSIVYQEFGDYEKGIQYTLKALEELRKIDNKFFLSVNYYNLALAYEAQDAYEDALQAYIDSLRFANEAGDEIGKAYAQYGIGISEAKLGNNEKALDSLIQAAKKLDKASNVEMSIGTRLESTDIAIEIENYKVVEQLFSELKEYEATMKELRYPRRQYFELQAKYFKKIDNQSAYIKAIEELNDIYWDEIKRLYKKTEENSKEKLDNNLDRVHVKRIEADLTLSQKRLENLVIQIESQRYWLIAMIASTVLLFLTLIVVHRKQRMFSKFDLFDDLTHLPNKLLLLKLIETQLKRNRFRNKGLSVAIIDLDLFRLINEQHGKELGDKVLTEVSREILSCIRKTDRIGRYDDEKFAAILPDNDELEAINTLERIRFAIQELPIKSIPNLSVTASIGYTTLAERDMKAEDLLDRAVQALYLAKAKGRNCIEYRQASLT